MGNFENLGISPVKNLGVVYRVCLHDGDSVMYLKVPPHFLMSFVEVALASGIRVEIFNCEVCNGDSCISKQ